MKTAQALPHGPSLVSYVEGWRDRSRRRTERAKAWRDRIRRRVDAVVELLVKDFGVSKVVLFGSFARGEAAPGSDVDLLVTGIETEKIIEASVAADRILGESTVDLVPVHLARLEVRKRAESEGTVLYGR